MRKGLDPLSTTGFSVRDIIAMAAISLSFIFLTYFLIGLRPDHLILVVLFNGLYFSSLITRKLILGFCVFVVYWVIFDYMKAFPNYEFSEVHIKSLHDTELRLFGINSSQGLITPNEYWLLHQKVWIDVLCGIFYLCWIPVPVFFGVALFFKNREQFLRFSFTFLMANFVGFIIYYTYSAAPPWYYKEFGTQFIPNTAGNIAGLARFDAYFNISVFKDIYSKSSNVFAAMPSLHSAYPLVVLYFGLKNKFGFVNILLALVTCGIWFAAVYTSHHYVIDVLVGIGCAVAGILVFEFLVRRSPFNALYARYVKLIS